MRLLHAETRMLQTFPSDLIPPYVILSHTWEEKEISLQDIKADNADELRGYEKVKMACLLALKIGVEYVWIDTCCIDKTSSAELSEALNSMYRWYQEAEICYAYLADVLLSPVDEETDVANSKFRKSKWFTRGWTLQELLAPERLVFLNQEWHEIGTKSDLQPLISQITQIPGNFLLGEDLSLASIAQRMAWASGRETTRKEDLAYSLMGIFGIYMPMLYGEGERAFIRLQEEIMKISDDHSIFAWRSEEDYSGRVAILATSPAAFAKSSNIIPTNPAFAARSPAILTSRGIHLSLHLASDTEENTRVILQCTEKGKENNRFTIYLQDMLLNNEDFVRVKSTELELINVGGGDLSNYPLKSLYVRQWLPIRNKKQGNTSTCEVKLGDIAEEDASSYITNCNQYCKLANGQITMNISTLADGIFGRLFVTCQDGNFFQVLLKKHKGSLLIEIATTTTTTTILDTIEGHSTPSRAESQQNQDQILEKLGDGQTVHVAIEERIHLRYGKERPLEVAKISYSNKIGQIWLDHMIIWEDKIEKELLWCAVDKGVWILVNQMLNENKADMDLLDNNGRSLLCRAAEGGHERLVKELLENGANANTRDQNGRTPLSCAAGSGKQSVVELLLQKVSIPEESGRSRNQKYLSRSIFQLLSTKGPTIKKGADFEAKEDNGRMPLWPHPEEADNNRRTLLSWAVEGGNEAVITLLLEKGANIEARDGGRQTPLSWAARSGHEAVVALLLEKGADIETTDITSRTPLSWAVRSGHEAVVALLLEKGADIKARDGWGQTPLLWAAAGGHEAVVALLLEKGADIETTDMRSRTPLLWAVRSGHEAVVALLLEKGADIEARDGGDQTPLSWAARSGHEAVVALLLEKGAVS